MINKNYLQEEIIVQIKEAFSENEFVRLEGFLDEDEYNDLNEKINRGNGKLAKIPDRYSYSLIDNREAESVVNSSKFKEFLFRIIGKKFGKTKLSVKRFGWKDYTLVHDDEAGKEETRFFFIIADKWDSAFGGQIVYLTENGLGNPLVFPIAGNSFCIIRKRKDMHSFVKYVNNLAGKRSFVVVEGKIN